MDGAPGALSRRSFLLLAGAAGCASPISRPEQSRPPPALWERIDRAAMAALRAARACPGLALAVYTRAGVFARGYGVIDVDGVGQVDAETPFYIASTTKPLTALALSSVATRGELDLSATLAALAPNAQWSATTRPDDVTLRHLLTHTHGLSNRPLVHRLAYTGVQDSSMRWRLLANAEANAESPFGDFQYGNVGYNIATVLTDHALAMTWQDLLDREVFAPAGMRNSSAHVPLDRPIARPHMLGPDGSAIRTYLEKSDATMHSAGGVMTSASDAARWLELMVEDGRIGGRQVVAVDAVIATRQPVADTGGGNAYGLGWRVSEHHGEPAFYHTGDFPGFAAAISYMPRRGVGFAAFSNGDKLGGRMLDALMYYVFDLTSPDADAEAGLADALDGLAARHEEIAIQAAADLVARAGRMWTLSGPKSKYVGRYHNEAWGEIVVSVDGDDMRVTYGVMHASAEPHIALDAILAELLPGAPVTITFEGAPGQPVALRYNEQRFVRG